MPKGPPVSSPKQLARRPLFKVRRSKIQGRGVFATAAIPKGTRIVEYLGERISSKEADARYDDEIPGRHHTFLFSVSARVVIDASHEGNDARFINHSCAPNCEALIERGRVFIYAKKNIAEGAELAYDYAYRTDASYSREDLGRLYPCRCGAAQCRGTLAKPPRAKRATAVKSTTSSE